jgi:hypothetical protein
MFRRGAKDQHVASPDLFDRRLIPIVASDTQLRSCHTISATDLFRTVVAQTQRDPEKSAACFVPSQGRPVQTPQCWLSFSTLHFKNS